jgi:hypothetical protein
VDDGRQYVDWYCHWDGALKKHLVCAEFYFAKIRGDVVPSKYLGTWIIPDSIPRDMSWEARYYAGERGNFEDHSGDPFGLWDCCFCGGETEPIPAPRIARGEPTSDGE